MSSPFVSEDRIHIPVSLCSVASKSQSLDSSNHTHCLLSSTAALYIMAIPLWWKVIYSFLTWGQGYSNTLHLVPSLKHIQKHQPVHNGAAQHLNEMRAHTKWSTRAFCCCAISNREWKMHFSPPRVVEMALWSERLRFSQLGKEIPMHCFRTGFHCWGRRVSYWKATSWKAKIATWFPQSIIDKSRDSTYIEG